MMASSFEMRAPAALRVALWIWVALIFHSTLATRQHVALDLLAGTALAAFAARLFLQTKNHRP